MDTEFTPPVERYIEEELNNQDIPQSPKSSQSSDFNSHHSAKKQSPVVLLVLLLLVLAIPVTAFVLSSRSQIADERSRAASTYPCAAPNKCTTSSLCNAANGGLIVSGSCTDPANPICCSFGATSTPKPPTATPTPLCSNGWIPTTSVGCCPGGADLCSTVGATQCNGNILAECKVFNAACPAANRNYWAGVGSCVIGGGTFPGDTGNCLGYKPPPGETCTLGSYSCPGQREYGSGCNLNGTRSVTSSAGQICLPNKLTCGVEQIDVNCGGSCPTGPAGDSCRITYSPGFKFKSRMYTSSCTPPPAGTATPLPPVSTITPPLIRATNTPPPAITNTPPLIRVTNTPTRPPATSTPVGTLTCQKLEAYLGTVNVTNNLGVIKYGDVVTFKGYANQTNVIVKSLSFQMTIAGKAQPIITVPATKEGTVYTAKFQYTFTTVGAHLVKVISINK